jgi:hypothetical protein
MALTRLRARWIVIVGTRHYSRAGLVSLDDRAERRQVTVLFSDLVGSTALSARLCWARSAVGFVIRVAPKTTYRLRDAVLTRQHDFAEVFGVYTQPRWYLRQISGIACRTFERVVHQICDAALRRGRQK